MTQEERVEKNAQILAESYRRAKERGGAYAISPMMNIVTGEYLPYTEEELKTIKRAQEINASKND